MWYQKVEKKDTDDVYREAHPALLGSCGGGCLPCIHFQSFLVIHQYVLWADSDFSTYIQNLFEFWGVYVVFSKLKYSRF